MDLNRDISNFIDPVIQDFIYQNGLYLRDSQEKRGVAPPAPPRHNVDLLAGKQLGQPLQVGGICNVYRDIVGEQMDMEVPRH